MPQFRSCMDKETSMDPFREAANRVAPFVGRNTDTDARLIAAEFAPLAERLAALQDENRRLREACEAALSTMLSEIHDQQLAWLNGSGVTGTWPPVDPNAIAAKLSAALTSCQTAERPA